MIARRSRPDANRLMGRTIAVTVLVASLVGVRAHGGTALTAAELEHAVGDATTAADHRALADYFDAAAKAARAAAEQQRALAATYRRFREPSVFRAHHWNLGRTMAPRCEALAKSFEVQAREYATMAAEHRRAAQTLERQ